MANNKDFVVKNPVEVTTQLQEEVGGTITSSTTTVGYDIANRSRVLENFDPASQDSQPTGAAFKDDGTKLYITGFTNGSVYQYSLSTAYDIRTRSYDDKSFLLSGQETSPRSVAFKTDGTIMYILGDSGNDITQYTLSTAWDVSTASYASKVFSVSSQETSPRDFVFKDDGLTFFLLGTISDDIHEYSMSTAWDISTASYTNNKFAVDSRDTNATGLAFNSDGTKFFMTGISSDSVYQYSMSTAWDITTASYDNVSTYLSGVANPVNLLFSADGSLMLVVDEADTVRQYKTGYVQTTKTLDLSTSNYFEDRPDPYTKYEFTNAAPVQQVVLNLTSSSGEPDISKARYDGDYTRVNFSGYTNITSLFVTNNDTVMYFTNSNGRIGQLTLGDSGALYSSYYNGGDVLSGRSFPSVSVKPDGTKMFVFDRATDTVYQYSLSTAFDITTASIETGTFVTTGGGETSPSGFFVKPDGTKMFICGTLHDNVDTFDLSTAWDVSTASFNSSESSPKFYDLYDGESISNDPHGLVFTSDGLKFYWVGTNNVEIDEYTMTTAWNPATAYLSNRWNVQGTLGTNSSQLAINSDNTILYIVGGDEAVRAVSIADPGVVTWDDSVKWTNGAEPLRSRNRSEGVYLLSTSNSGTTFIGQHVAKSAREYLSP